MLVQVDMVNINNELDEEKVCKKHDTKLKDDIVDGDHHDGEYNSVKNENESVAL
jgi:hypothetical protein